MSIEFKAQFVCILLRIFKLAGQDPRELGDAVDRIFSATEGRGGEDALKEERKAE